MADDKKGGDSGIKGAVKEAAKEGAKQMAVESIQSAGGLLGLWALAKNYIFPGSIDSNGKTEGLQAHRDGRGQTDEALFFEAIARAAKNIEKDDLAKRNQLIARFFTVFNSLAPSIRTNAILCVGLSESKITGKDPDGKDVTTTSNVRGTTILESWLQMDEATLRLTLAAPVQPFDVTKERFQTVNQMCGRINAELERINGPLPASQTPEERQVAREERRRRIGTNMFSSLFSRTGRR